MSLVTTLIEQLALANWACSVGGPLEGLNLHAGSVNAAFTPGTTLASVTECVFPGYRVATGVNGIAAYIGGDGLVHVAFPGNLFEATDGDTQVISNVAIGPITTAGNLSVVVTAAGMTGSPRTVTVAVLTTDTNTGLATKITTALAADADVGAFFTPTSALNVVTLTAKTKAANDATMNMSFATGTAVGLTPEPTATQVYPGYAPGASFSTQIANCYLTDAANTFLVGGQMQLPITQINNPGDGVYAVPDFIWGQ